MNTNEKKEITIRIAKEEDAEELLAIYAPYIEYTVITYEYDVPTVEEFRGRIRHVLERYPYLVAEEKYVDMHMQVLFTRDRQEDGM